MPHRILKVSENGMLDAYDATLKAKGFKSDPAQRAAAQRLQGLYSELVAFKAARRGALRKLLSRPKQPRSVYFWGGVGRGKSFLMDCFFDPVAPFFTTDTAAALRGAEIGAQVVLKATKVDGVYSADPKKDPAATRYTQISFDEAISKNLQVMDATAFALCRDQKLPIKVFSIFKPGALKRVVQGEDEGTLVHV